MPKERKRNLPDLPVPNGEEDAAERKRVLNVLAQRRYRKRKREHIQALESQLKTTASSVGTTCPEGCVPEIASSGDNLSAKPPLPQHKRLGDNTGNTYDIIAGSTKAWISTAMVEDASPLLEVVGDSNMPNYAIDLGYNTIGVVDNFNSPALVTATATTTLPSFAPVSPMPTEVMLADFDISPECTFDTTGQLCQVSWSGSNSSPSLAFTPLITPSITSNTDSSNSPSTSTNHFPNPLSHHTLLNPSTPPPPHPPSPAALQTYLSSHTTFPDARLPSSIPLTILTASLRIATSLSIGPEVWSLDALSPFSNPPNPTKTPPPTSHLPLNIRPTPQQLTIPHHPILDLLPWPSVRTKLILVFSLPDALRPPVARGPTALLELVADIEDVTDGVRVHGEDPLRAENWEVGDILARRWWWALDRAVVGGSNRWRRERGEAILGRTTEEVDRDR